MYAYFFEKLECDHVVILCLYFSSFECGVCFDIFVSYLFLGTYGMPAKSSILTYVSGCLLCFLVGFMFSVFSLSLMAFVSGLVSILFAIVISSILPWPNSHQHEDFWLGPGVAGRSADFCIMYATTPGYGYVTKFYNLCDCMAGRKVTYE